VKLSAQKNKRVITWTGRPIHFQNKRFCYKAPNALIQGGCSDVGKIALIELDRYLASRKSKILVLVHDENLFEVHNSELDIVPELKRIMESIYPPRRLPLTCSVSWSAKSWGDLIDGVPIVKTEGDSVQRASDRKTEATTNLVY
jgi:DNA polymerase I-like protein with 3'-5' exonuclease and polymerase domains